MSSKQAASEAFSKVKKYRDVFMFSLGAYALMTEEPIASLVSNYRISATNNHLLVESIDATTSSPKETGYTISFGESLPKDAALSVVQATFYSMLADSFEVCKALAPEKIKNEDWYSLARHFRNAISHDGKWNFNQANFHLVKWRSLKIDQSMHGQPIDGYMGWFDGLQLSAVMLIFVDDLVKSTANYSVKAVN